jgi:hypothetical protein
MLRISSLIVLALLATTSAYCEVYKWVDPDGTVHYSDQPAPGTIKEEQTLGIKSGTSGTEAPGTGKAAPKPAGPKTYIEEGAEFRKRQVEAEEKAKKEEKALADAKVRQQNCGLSRDNMRALQSGQRLARINKNGEREYLDDSQIQQGMADAQKSIDSWCNPAK